MEIPSREKVEEYARLKANSQPNPVSYYNGIMECYNKFIEPLSSSPPCDYYTVESWEQNKTFKLNPCPFCGGEPEVLHKGNDYTKSRKITIKCKKCRCQRTDAAIRNSMEWLEGIAIKNWNQKPSV